MTIPLLGRDTFLFVNTGVLSADGTGTWVEVDLATDLTVDRSKTEIDVTNRESARSGYTATAQGLKALKVEFDSHKPAEGETANAGSALLAAAFLDNSVIEAVVADGDINTGTAVPAQFFEANVGGGSEAQPLNDAVTVATSLTNLGAPLSGTYTTGTPTLS